MQYLIEDLEKSIQDQNWYAALTLALTLPDICGKIDSPKAGSGVRYAEWFTQWVQDKYSFATFEGKKIFLSGRDCYALRCALLHEGSTDITTQRARDVLDDFQFVVDSGANFLHCNQIDNKLQLDTATFCRDIAQGVRSWLATSPKLKNMLQIRFINSSEGFTF